MRIGLISDTHGLLRPQALAALGVCDHLIHAGDIGDPAVLSALAQRAPLTAVRGNNDVGADYQSICETVTLELAGARILVVHDLQYSRSEVAAAQVDVVISGHSHKPLIERREGRLYVNPGSAGPRRFRLPVTIAHLSVTDAGIEAWLTELQV